MTDLEKWEEFLESFGISYSLVLDHYSETRVLRLKAKYDQKVQGYTGFVMDILFTGNKFKFIQLYEQF